MLGERTEIYPFGLLSKDFSYCLQLSSPVLPPATGEMALVVI